LGKNVMELEDDSSDDKEIEDIVQQVKKEME
jgi:hypothetical protein